MQSPHDSLSCIRWWTKYASIMMLLGGWNEGFFAFFSRNIQQMNVSNEKKTQASKSSVFESRSNCIGWLPVIFLSFMYFFIPCSVCVCTSLSYYYYLHTHTCVHCNFSFFFYNYMYTIYCFVVADAAVPFRSQNNGTLLV